MKVMIITFIVIAIIIVWIIFNTDRLHHLETNASASNSASDSQTMQIARTFIITVGDKTENNTLLNRGSKQTFYVDGIEAPTIFLKRNLFYEFKIETDEPFYFSSDQNGGIRELPDGTLEEAVGAINLGFKGLARGSVYFMATDDLPAFFYYQSSKHENMGSIVQLR